MTTEVEEKRQTTVIRWASRDEKDFVHAAARQDNRSMSNFILNAAKLHAEKMLGRSMEDDEYFDDDDDDDDEDDYED